MKTQPMNPDEIALLESRRKLTENILGELIYDHTKEHDSAERFIILEKMLNSLAQSNEVLFAVKRKSSNRKWLHATHLGRILLQYISFGLPEIMRHLVGHTFNPTVATLIKHVYTLELDVRANVLAKLTSAEVVTTVDKLNAFVQELRSELQTDRHRTEEAKFKRNAKDNKSALVRYFEEWFEYRAKVLLLRIDLGYAESDYNAANGCPKKPFAQMAEKTQAHRDLFFKHVRKHFKGEKVGYAWKLEYGLFKGFHCHVILLLNGDKHWSDVNLTKQLGEYWKNTITEGQGLYFNCNAQKHVYTYPAVGLLHACDDKKWKGLEHIARYLTKPDGYIKLELPGNSRVFGKGTRPTVPQVRLGRQRTKHAARAPLQAGSIRGRHAVHGHGSTTEIVRS